MEELGRQKVKNDDRYVDEFESVVHVLWELPCI